MKLGAIEAGGTKFVVCIGNEKGEVLERESFIQILQVQLMVILQQHLNQDGIIITLWVL